MASSASDSTRGLLTETLTSSGNGHARPLDGLISGYVFKLIRESLGLSQDGLADVLGLDKNTVQGWESGRRPLATWVNNRAFTELLAWPFTGETPSALAAERKTARRGPVPTLPALPAVDRQRFFEHLKIASEKSLADNEVGNAASLLLRRQAYYMIAWNRESETRTWLSDMQRQEQRQIRRLDGWSPLWVAARSLAVARACQGDSEPLLHFIKTAIDASDACEAANLNYWAYWAGATGQVEYSDEFMATDLGPWNGATLLRRLQENLTVDQPYIDLSIHAVWALLQRRGRILQQDTRLTASMLESIDALLDNARVSPRSRKELEQVYFAGQVAQQENSEHLRLGRSGDA